MAGSSFHSVFQNVDEYIAARPVTAQPALNQVRRAIRSGIPQAGETISYNIPTYKVKERAAVCFAGWKRFYSIYPASKVMLAKSGDELAEADIVKSAIRFRFSGPVPTKLIGKIAKFRANEIAGL